MAADGFVSLSRPDVGFNLIYLRTGLETFKPDSMRGHRADGLLVVFVVDDIDAEYARLQREGVRDHHADPDRGLGRAVLPGHATPTGS